MLQKKFLQGIAHLLVLRQHQGGRSGCRIADANVILTCVNLLTEEREG